MVLIVVWFGYCWYFGGLIVLFSLFISLCAGCVVLVYFNCWFVVVLGFFYFGLLLWWFGLIGCVCV